MFTGIDLVLAIVITFVLTAFSCLFMAGVSTKEREDEAYEEGYKQGYVDGMKVGGNF